MAVLRATSVFLFIALAGCSVGEVGGGNTPPVDSPPTPPPVDGPPSTADGPATDGPATPIDAPPTGGGPAESFEAMVKPIVTKKIGTQTCVDGGCHSGANAPNMTSYDKLIATPIYLKQPGAMSRLVNHGQHSGPALPGGDKATIAAWIDTLPPP